MTAMIRPSFQRDHIPPLDSEVIALAASSSKVFTIPAGTKEIRVDVDWVKGNLTSSAIVIVPAGDSANQLTPYTQGDAAGGPGDLFLNRMVVCTGNRGPSATGKAWLNLATGKFRTGVNLFGVGGDAATPTSNRNCYGYLLYQNSATAIGSIQLVCLDTATLLPTADLLPGTEFNLYKVR